MMTIGQVELSLMYDHQVCIEDKTSETLLNVLFDFPVGFWSFSMGLSVLLLVLVLLIIVTEAIVLYWFHFDSFRRSLGSSLVMNIFSSFLGFIAAPGVELSPDELVPDYYADFEEVAEWFFFAESHQFPGILPATAIFLMISWIISVISEGVVLWLLGKNHPANTIWLLAIVANGISYVVLLSPYIVIILAPDVRPDIFVMLSWLVIGSLYLLFVLAEHWLIFIGLSIFSGSLIWWRARRAKV